MARSCNPFLWADIRGRAALGRSSRDPTALPRKNWGWRPSTKAVPALESYGCGTLVFWSASFILALLAFSAFAMGRLMGFGGRGGVSWGPRGLSWLPGSPGMGSLNCSLIRPDGRPRRPRAGGETSHGPPEWVSHASRRVPCLLVSLQAASPPTINFVKCSFGLGTLRADCSGSKLS